MSRVPRQPPWPPANFIAAAHPLIQQVNRDTWYDQQGRIVFTASKGLSCVGFPRNDSGRGANNSTGWDGSKDMQRGSVSRAIIDDTLPGGPRCSS